MRSRSAAGRLPGRRIKFEIPTCGPPPTARDADPVDRRPSLRAAYTSHRNVFRTPPATSDAVQYEPFRFLPPASSQIGSTANDTWVPRAAPANPAEVANADAPMVRPNTAPSELVTRGSSLSAAASPARARRIASATSIDKTLSSHS